MLPCLLGAFLLMVPFSMTQEVFSLIKEERVLIRLDWEDRHADETIPSTLWPSFVRAPLEVPKFVAPSKRLQTTSPTKLFSRALLSEPKLELELEPILVVAAIGVAFLPLPCRIRHRHMFVAFAVFTTTWALGIIV